jgi:hypothetical protein
MKTILAGAALATFLALTFSAPSQASERPAAAEFYAPQQQQQQQQQSGTSYQGFYLPGQRSNQPSVNWDTTGQSLCSTAHDFCPGFHGDNG